MLWLAQSTDGSVASSPKMNANPVASNAQMTKTLVFFALLLCRDGTWRLSFAQYGGQGLGSALSSDPSSHQGQVRAGVDDIARKASQETPFKVIKDVKLGLKDADPNVRVSELTKLRDLQDPEVERILIQSMADPDLRVKLKAIDILGHARPMRLWRRCRRCCFCDPQSKSQNFISWRS